MNDRVESVAILTRGLKFSNVISNVQKKKFLSQQNSIKCYWVGDVKTQGRESVCVLFILRFYLRKIVLSRQGKVGSVGLPEPRVFFYLALSASLNTFGPLLLSGQLKTLHYFKTLWVSSPSRVPSI